MLDVTFPIGCRVEVASAPDGSTYAGGPIVAEVVGHWRGYLRIERDGLVTCVRPIDAARLIGAGS